MGGAVASGILVAQNLEQLVAGGAITASEKIQRDDIKPASQDLRIEPTVYRVKSSFLPQKGEKVWDIIKEQRQEEVDLANNEILWGGGIYITPLVERLQLPQDFRAEASPKSSTGRTDMLVRILADGIPAFDTVPKDYKGPLYLQIIPNLFNVQPQPHERLVQLRPSYGGQHALSSWELQLLYTEHPLLRDKENQPIPLDQVSIDDCLTLTIDLEGVETQYGRIIGYKGKINPDPINFRNLDHFDPLDFFEPVPPPKNGYLIVQPDEFFILSSCEKVVCPIINGKAYAGEMVAFDPRIGDHRSHYAGYFDPGWEDTATLELRAFGIPLTLRHGQPVCRIRYYHCLEVPMRDGAIFSYGTMSKANYRGQDGPCLAKFFKKVQGPAR